MATLNQGVKAVVLDWDETITRSDTMSILSEATNDPSRWPEFVDAYMSDMQRHEESSGDLETLSDHFEYLGSLSSVEICSVRRIESAGVFKGVTHADLEKAAAAVEIRDGFEAFCQRLGPDVAREILSVNWSKEFIRCALPTASEPDHWKITANSLEFGDDGKCTGAVSKDKNGGMRTALDKLEYLRSRMLQVHKIDGLLIYVGDSNTDLPCLLEADLGIIFGQNESLRQKCEKYGIQTLPFAELDVLQPYARKNKVLYQILSWDELKF